MICVALASVAGGHQLLTGVWTYFDLACALTGLVHFLCLNVFDLSRGVDQDREVTSSSVSICTEDVVSWQLV